MEEPPERFERVISDLFVETGDHRVVNGGFPVGSFGCVLIEGIHIHVLSLTIVFDDAGVGVHLAPDEDFEVSAFVSILLFDLPKFVNVANSSGLLTRVFNEGILIIEINLGGDIFR